MTMRVGSAQAMVQHLPLYMCGHGNFWSQSDTAIDGAYRGVPISLRLYQPSAQRLKVHIFNVRSPPSRLAPEAVSFLPLFACL